MSALLAVLRALAYACRHSSPDCAPVVVRGELRCACEFSHRKAACGFDVVKFSHPGKTKQTPGIADRRYYHRARGVAFWWEAKSATGRQRPDQVLFQEMCDAVGDPYCLGTDHDLFTWLLARYPLVRDEQGHLIWRGE